MSDPTTLYRLYDRIGRLLYVGIAGNPGRRFEQHRKDKPWWGDVARTELQHFETRADALQAELTAIRSERPLHNVAGSVREQPAAHTSTVSPERVLAVCQKCGKRVRGKDGYVHINELKVCEVEQQVKDWERRVDESQTIPGLRMIQGPLLLEYPEPARWMVHHGTCDPEPTAPDYFMYAEDISTWAEVTSWTAHLMEKAWLKYTDWRDLLQRLAQTGLITGGERLADSDPEWAMSAGRRERP